MIVTDVNRTKEGRVMTNEMTVCWPEVFTDENFEYDTSSDTFRREACADGLTGWAACVLEKSPAPFGRGMVKIGAALGIAPTQENLMAYADTLKQSGKV